MKPLLKFVKDNIPVICTAAAAAGTLVTGVLAARGHELALSRTYGFEQPTLRETAKIVRDNWTCYIPAACFAVVTVAALVTGHQVLARRLAGTFVLYEMAESSAARWQSAAREALHDDAYEAVKEHKDSRREAEIVPVVLPEDVFVDDYSGRIFRSKLETIRKHVNDVNERLLHGTEAFVSLNDWYNMIGLPTIAMGDWVGWDDTYLLEVEYSAVIHEDGSPVGVVSFRNPPRGERAR